ncbi:hypothetical protein VOLCADRAFT_108271 [Volvox carteri f. nagariensis]|uniref:Thioredoxin domain-containing protein n=1 Tax=Volvox carteri f. nagariensis TaxID=3068 RepID=D8UJ78_VOLCA|nr:uncharacterized protein VOLCADRAFT_108271 [Volvox carteri f. nagariensis]EFJ40226.1 hypothetical protein VOLCADRAFT_108271 [Volvox carteri f. nagariensis]|eukprot:XP_002958706.1 hypothetical protein VOLCADRAFT_108271 [Volvox carteri f. nagariensis]
MTDKPADVICEGDVCRRVTPEEAASIAETSAGTAEPRVFKLLGSTSLKGKGDSQEPLSSITGPNKVIALYFSAHWCPPCRQFTPKLAATYKSFKETHPRAADWEVVFVSSDRDEKSFDGYYESMPWLALPFSERETKAALSSLYKVRGIPTLVVIDGETGELITSNGRDAVGDDPECENFPWRPKTFTQIMEGATLVEPGADKDAAPIPALDRLSGKVTLLYFSASWCPPCRRFTPMLVEAMKALRDAGKTVEGVFVSGDRDEAAMKEYHSHMTWLALPFADSKRRNELNMRFEVEGIPTLVVLDEDFNVITTEGVGAIQSDPSGERFPWRPQPLEQLSDYNVSRINSGPVLLLLVAGHGDGGDAAAEDFAKQVLEPVAKATRAAPGGEDWSFFWATKGDEMAGRVVEFVGGVKQEEGQNTAVLVDVAGSQSSWDLGDLGVQMTEEGLAAAVANFKAGKLGKGRPLGE